MLRKATQLLFLPFLFALLAAGGKTTLCDVLSVVGMESHHHPHEAVHEDADSLCLESHDHEHQHKEVPCPESCEIPLAEAPAPVLLKVPAVSETLVVPFLLQAMLAAPAPIALFGTVEKHEPPDHVASLIDPIFTGRFLV